MSAGAATVDGAPILCESCEKVPARLVRAWPDTVFALCHGCDLAAHDELVAPCAGFVAPTLPGLEQRLEFLRTL